MLGLDLGSRDSANRLILGVLWHIEGVEARKDSSSDW